MIWVKASFFWLAFLFLDTHIQGGCLLYSYEAVDFICYDSNCNTVPIQDNPRLENYNLDIKMDEFYAWADLYVLLRS